VSALLLLAACTAVCKGPGCEADWPASRLAVFRGNTLIEGQLDPATEATLFTGSDDAGSSWSVAGLPEQMLIAQPDADAVVLVDDLDEGGDIAPVASWISDGTRFGAAMAVDRSNRDESFNLWVGGPDWGLGTGAVWLFGDAHLDGLREDASNADLRIAGSSAADQFGTNIVLCGDLTGDDLPEVAVTAPWLEETVSDCSDLEQQPTFGLERICSLAGSVFLLHSELLQNASTGDDPWDLGTVYLGSTEGDGAGHAVVCDRDLTGDGIPDLVIGAPWYDNAAGRVYIIEGGNLGEGGSLDEATERRIDPPNKGENWLGMSLTTLSLFGDNAFDLAIGAPGFGGGKGRVLLYRGASLINSNSPDPYRQIRADETREEVDHMGRWLATGSVYAGNLSDLVVGAPDYRGGTSNPFDTGHAWVWRGDDSSDWEEIVHVADATAEIVGTEPFQRVGRRPAIHDVDGDGLDDILLVTRSESNE